MKHSLIKVGMITTSILLSCGITKNVQAATNQPDQYEVKVYADSHKVVKDNRHIKHSVLEALGSSDKDEDFNVQYLDDSNRTNYQNNVTYRLRKSEDDNYHKLQYKSAIRFLIMMSLVQYNKLNQKGITATNMRLNLVKIKKHLV